MIASAKEEAKAIEAQERREKLEQILESQIEQARKQYEKQKHD